MESFPFIKISRASSYMSPVIGLARLPGQILSSVRMGIFSPVDRDEIQETQTKMVEHKLVSFVTVIALWTPVKAYSHTPTAEIHTRQKLRYFGRNVEKGKLFCQKKVSSRFPGLDCSYEKFLSCSPRSR